jgi:hypothetical protein
MCVNGQLASEVFECPGDLLFDPVIGECNIPTQVECNVTEPPPVGFPDCMPGTITAHPYPGNCTLYIICVDGSMTFYKCPDGMLFDNVDKECKPQSDAVCAKIIKLKDLSEEMEDFLSVEDSRENSNEIPSSFPSSIKTFFMQNAFRGLV